MHLALEVASSVLLAASAALALPVLVLVVQVASAWRVRRPATSSQTSRPAPSGSEVTVLMPAHDEAEGIAASIASVRAQLGEHDRLLVVADNCSDATARIAMEAGAEVVERHDPGRRGKGFALDHGVRHLAAAPPSVVVIVDADCLLGPDSLDRLVCRCLATGRPVQALYLMRSPQPGSLKTRVAEFAWIVRNQVRPLGFHRLGLPCQLMGTGMAFPWQVIARAPLASGHLVEDLQLGLDLAASGTPPTFCPQAVVTSVFPVGAAALLAQRTRWEHGSVGVIVGRVPRLLAIAIGQGNGALAAMVLDLAVPPIAALTLALGLVASLAAGVALLGGSPVALVIVVAALMVLLLSLAVAWRGFAAHVVGASELATIPFYLLAKIPLYARLLWRRQTEWVRTGRDDGRR